MNEKLALFLPMQQGEAGSEVLTSAPMEVEKHAVVGSNEVRSLSVGGEAETARRWRESTLKIKPAAGDSPSVVEVAKRLLIRAYNKRGHSPRSFLMQARRLPVYFNRLIKSIIRDQINTILDAKE